MKKYYVIPTTQTMSVTTDSLLMAVSQTEIEVKGNYEDNHVTDLSRRHKTAWDDDEDMIRNEEE